MIMNILLWMAFIGFVVSTRARLSSLQSQVDFLKGKVLGGDLSGDAASGGKIEGPGEPLILSGRLVKVTDPGDTELMLQERVDEAVFEQHNRRAEEAGKRPAKGKPV